MLDSYLNSDELRDLTQAGASFYQVEKLQKLGVPFSLDPYGTPLVKRADVNEFFKPTLDPLYKKFGVNPEKTSEN
jgi:hypothetical protein